MTVRARTHRRALLAGTALAATLGFGWAAPAAAQIVGTVTSTSGTNLTVGATNVTDVTITQPEAIINWNVAGGATATDVAFLPLNNTVTFHETPVSFVGSNYTVLNRVFPVTLTPTGPAPLNATINIGGTVNATFNGKQGGNIWFYSPHGIITSGSASFNVGGLLLTTSDIDTSNGGSLFTAQATGLDQVTFLPATDPNAKVQIGQATTISAAGIDTNPLAGYVGIFAPRIEQGGAVSASGMVGYAAGEAGQFTFTDGMVSILITQGTDETAHQGIVHSGTTGTTAGGALPRSIQMVAMPKNTALTMLLSGSIGYDAVNATSDGSTVTLSAGYQQNTSQPEIALARGNMEINNATIAGDPTIFATGTLSVLPKFISAAQPGLTRFVGFTQLNVGKKLLMDAGTDAGSLIDFTDSLQVNALRFSLGEDVQINSTGGTIAIAGDASIDASGQAAFAAATPTVGADGVGGNVGIFINDGALTVGADFTVTANGFGEDGGDFGGNGLGGSIDMHVSGGGTISSVGPLGFAANGFGGFAANDGGAGGTGTGGVLTLRDDGGLLDFPSVDLSAKGYGASGLGLNPVPSDGLGGQIAITIAGQAQSWTSLNADASAFNDGGNVAGNAIGNLGGVKLQATGTGDLTLGALTLTNDAVIQSGGTTVNTGMAGGLDLLVNAGGKLTVTGLTRLSATARNTSGNPQVGADMTGGILNVTVDGAASKLKVGGFIALADATLAGAGLTGGTATAGQVAVGATNGGLLQIVSATVANPPQVQIGAIAHAGYGPVTSLVTGGAARLYVQGGTIDATGVDLNVSAAAVGDGTPYDGSNTGFSATGGNASVEMLSGGTGPGAITAGNIFIIAKGEAATLFNPVNFGDFNGPFNGSGLRVDGSGGTGQGGTALLKVQSGTLTAGSIIVHADGLGGPADYNFLTTTPFTAGDGLGGQALVDQSGGSITASTLDLRSLGRGGSSSGFVLFDAPAPVPGIGRGGLAQAKLSGGTMDLSNFLFIAATAFGGDGSDAQSNSGSVSATAGALGDNSLALAELLMPNGSTASLTVPNASISAIGVGGNGGFDGATGVTMNGGNAIAGTARYSLADGAFSISNGGFATATAFGGSGDIGGSATGGTAAFLLADTLAAPATTRLIGPLSLTASSTGGTGNTTDGTATPGTTKFTARAGRAVSALTIDGTLSADAFGTVLAGDGFTGNLGAVPVQVNGDFLVNTTRDINMSVDAGGGINATGGISLTGQSITTTGTGVLAAQGAVSVQAVNSINLGGISAGTTTFLEAFDPNTSLYGPVTVASLSSVGLVSATGSTLSITSPGALTFDVAQATAGDLTIKTALGLTVPDVSATGTATLDAGGALHLTGVLDAANVVLKAGTTILTDAQVNTLGTFSATAGGTYTGTLALNVPGNTSIDAAGGISLPGLTSGGTTFLRAANAPIALSLNSTGAITLSAQSAAIFSPNALNFASATSTAGNLLISSASTLSVGNASASGALNLLSGGLLTISGAAEGATITLRSPDIAIGSTGRLGQRGHTTTISLINTAPLAGTRIGGTGQSGVWSLDSAEVGRLFADQSITISPATSPNAAASSSTAGPTSIGATALSYGTASTANLGSGGQFIVTTPASISVTGPVNFTTSTNADSLVLAAVAPGSAINVVTDNGGGIALTGSGGALLGTLRLSADTIRVATAAALADLSDLTTLSAVSDRLSANDGVVRDAGTIQAGSFVVSFGNRFFIQNSGAGTQFDQRRGFSANSISIGTQGTGPLQVQQVGASSSSAKIAINGVLFGTGRLTGGLTQRGTFINGVLAAAGGLFDPLSTINGCVIGRDCSTPTVQIIPPNDTITGLIGAIGPATNLLVMPTIQFGDMPLFDSPPLIDEPVTGVGNDDLWQKR